MNKATYFSVIDLGSNSVRLKVFEISAEGKYKIVREEREMVRLSEGMGTEKILQKEPIKRTVEALKQFQQILQTYEHCTVQAIATAATRSARNQKSFLNEVVTKSGIQLNVISGSQEAQYDYLGVSRTLPMPNCMLLDTGGGSTEMVLVLNRQVVQKISLPWGSVNLSERFLAQNKTTASSLFQLMTFIELLYHEIWWLKNGEGIPLVALGGSNRTLAKIQRRKEHKFDMEDLHGYRMSRDAVNKIFEEILDKDNTTRAEIPGLSRDRADIIIGGLVPIIQLMRFIDSSRVTFSKSGLREGVFFEYYEKHFPN